MQLLNEQKKSVVMTVAYYKKSIVLAV